jgi:2-oxo-4-hydroxy-4-carboxy--5-ureidoimidazoline (OHCU) decarboxylase
MAPSTFLLPYTFYAHKQAAIAMTMVVDKGVLKEALRELIHEEPEVFRNLGRDALADNTGNPSQQTDLSLVDDEEFDRFTQLNFQRFEATFRALA